MKKNLFVFLVFVLFGIMGFSQDASKNSSKSLNVCQSYADYVIQNKPLGVLIISTNHKLNGSTLDEAVNSAMPELKKLHGGWYAGYADTLIGSTVDLQYTVVISKVDGTFYFCKYSLK